MEENSKLIKLSDWASKNGVNYQTAYRWFKAGKLPVSRYIQTETGTILVEDIVINETDEKKGLTKSLIDIYNSKYNSKNVKYDDANYDNDKYVFDTVEIKLLLEQQKKELLSGNFEGSSKLSMKITELRTDEYEKRKFEALSKTVFSINENIDILKHDVDMLSSNMFGDNTVFLNRISSRIEFKINQAIDLIFKNAETFEDIKNNYKTYKEKLFNSQHMS